MAKTSGKGYGLLYEMGCGKTLTAIAIAGALYQQGKAKRALVVCPSTIIPVWDHELKQFADYPARCAQLNQSTKQRRLKALRDAQEAYDSEMLFVVINYEEVFREDIYEALLKYDADLVILDEGHRIKTHTSKTAKACYALGDKARYRLLLTGTPVTNTITDVFGIMRFVDRNVFGDNFYAFRNHYCVLGGFKGKQVVASRNEEECTRRLISRSMRVTKADALDLPEETFETRYVQLSKEERAMYDQLRKNAIMELEDSIVTAPMVITKMMRLKQLTGGFVRFDDEDKVRQVGHSKLDVLKETLTEIAIDNGHKVVVFAQFTAEVNAICETCTELGLKYVRIDGSVKQDIRGSIQDQFQTDPETMVFVGQLTAAGEGITLHAASYSIFYSTSFSYKDYSQAKARIHRKGQTQPCTHISLVAEDSIDEQTYEALSRKEDLSTRVVDNWRELFGLEEVK